MGPLWTAAELEGALHQGWGSGAGALLACPRAGICSEDPPAHEARGRRAHREEDCWRTPAEHYVISQQDTIEILMHPSPSKERFPKHSLAPINLKTSNFESSLQWNSLRSLLHWSGRYCTLPTMSSLTIRIKNVIISCLRKPLFRWRKTHQ